MEAQLKAIFKAADKDGNGTLSPEEIRTQLLTPSPYKKITEKEVEIALKQLDLDSDGKVSCQGNSYHFLFRRTSDNSKSFQSSSKSSRKYFPERICFRQKVSKDSVVPQKKLSSQLFLVWTPCIY